jgi:hypothetical protein
MPVNLTIDAFNPLDWVNEYARPCIPVDADTFEPILHFSLMWNLFEKDICGKDANQTSIEKSVQSAFAAKRLSLTPFEEHLRYFKTRAHQNGMTIERYLDALKMTNEKARRLTSGVLSGELTDPNNAIYALLLIAHRIRNNLFHGEKDVAMLHSQVDLFRTVNSLLATYITHNKNHT